MKRDEIDVIEEWSCWDEPGAPSWGVVLAVLLVYGALALLMCWTSPERRLPSSLPITARQGE